MNPSIEVPSSSSLLGPIQAYLRERASRPPPRFYAQHVEALKFAIQFLRDRVRNNEELCAQLLAERAAHDLVQVAPTAEDKGQADNEAEGIPQHWKHVDGLDVLLAFSPEDVEKMGDGRVLELWKRAKGVRDEVVLKNRELRREIKKVAGGDEGAEGSVGSKEKEETEWVEEDPDALWAWDDTQAPQDSVIMAWRSVVQSATGGGKTKKGGLVDV